MLEMGLLCVCVCFVLSSMFCNKASVATYAGLLWTIHSAG